MSANILNLSEIIGYQIFNTHTGRYWEDAPEHEILKEEDAIPLLRQARAASDSSSQSSWILKAVLHGDIESPMVEITPGMNNTPSTASHTTSRDLFLTYTVTGGELQQYLETTKSEYDADYITQGLESGTLVTTAGYTAGTTSHIERNDTGEIIAVIIKQWCDAFMEDYRVEPV